MRRHLAIVGAYFAQFVKMRLAYRADFVIDSAGVVAALAVQLAFLGVLYAKVTTLSGWTFDQLVFIHGFSLVPLGLFNLISPNLWSFSERYLVEGRFDRVLLRPVNPLFQVLFESFNVAALSEIVLGFALMAAATARLGLEPQLLDALVFPVLAVSAACVYLGVFVALTAVSFWFEDRLGVAPPAYNMIRFARYPLTIYHPAVRMLLSWVIPFGFAAFYPATRFLGADAFRFFTALTPVIGAACLALAAWLFHCGARRYASTGS
jgi:ABC-2 type transport system permease protein